MTRLFPPLRALAVLSSLMFVSCDDGTIIEPPVEVPESPWATVTNFHRAPDVTAAHAAATDAVYLGDEDGSLHYYDGAKWRRWENTLRGGVSSVWVASPDDVWATDTREDLWHYDGAAWEEVREAEIVYGLGPNDIYISTSYSVWHYDGDQWDREHAASRFIGNALFAGPGVVVAAGNVHVAVFDGSDWSDFGFSGVTLRAVWASAANDVWVVGDRQVHRYDGTTWTKTDLPVIGILTTVWGSEADNVYMATSAGGFVHWNGTDFTINDQITHREINALSGSAGEHIIAAGENGKLIGYDGTRWSNLWPDGPRDAHTAWAANKDQVVVQDWSSGVYIFDGGEWTESATGVGPLFAIWGASIDVVFAGGNRTVVRYFAGEWQTLTASLNGNVMAMWGTSATNVYAAGWATINHFDGSTWTEVVFDANLDIRDMWGSGPDDIYAVGSTGDFPYSGRVFHFDGTSWTELPDDFGVALYGVWGSGPDNVFAAGRGVYHFDGTTWTLEASALRALDISGNNGGDVFIVDNAGRMYRRHDGEWRAVEGHGASIVTSGSDGELLGIGSSIERWKGE